MQPRYTTLKFSNMSLFVEILVIATGIAVSLVVVSLHWYRRQTKTGKFPASFKDAAAAFSLSVTKQEVLGNRVIGIDEKNNNVLFLEARGSKRAGYLVGLEEIKNCVVKREYGAIPADSINNSSLESFVNRIALKLEYKNGTEPTVLTFYDSATDGENEIQERAEQAKAWQALLSTAIRKINNRPVQYKKSSGKREPVTDFAF